MLERAENIVYRVMVQSLRNIRASSLQEDDAEDDAAMILDTTSQTAISEKRLMPADPYRGRSSNASLPAGLLQVQKCEILGVWMNA